MRCLIIEAPQIMTEKSEFETVILMLHKHRDDYKFDDINGNFHCAGFSDFDDADAFF
jgi:hypothetical protein